MRSSKIFAKKIAFERNLSKEYMAAEEDEFKMSEIEKHLETGDFKSIREILEEIKESETKIDLSSFSCNSNKISKLCMAVVLGDIQVAQDLIQKGAQVDANIYYKRRPLHLAMMFGHTDMVHMLLRNGADPHLQSYPYMTVSPILMATAAGLDKELNLMLEHGANLNYRNKGPREGDTLLHFAIFFAIQYGPTFKNRNMLKFLMKLGASLTLKNKRGYVPLEHCLVQLEEFHHSAHNYVLGALKIFIFCQH